MSATKITIRGKSAVERALKSIVIEEILSDYFKQRKEEMTPLCTYQSRFERPVFIGRGDDETEATV